MVNCPKVRRVLLLLLLSAVQFSCGREGESSAAGAERVVAGIGTALVSVRSFDETVNATGVVSGRPEGIAVLSAPAPARIAAVLVVVGQHVSAGTVLVELDQVGFRATTQSAEAALSAADSNRARQQRLADAGIASRRDLEQAVAMLASARADAERARRESELSVLRSPIAGVVTQVRAVLGATADPAQLLVEVTDISALDLVLALSPAQAAGLRPGARVDLLSGAVGDTASLGEATVVAIGGAIDAETRAVPVRAALRRTSRTVRIGESIDARIVIGTRSRALVVPLESLVPDGELFKVFVVDSVAVVHARAVVVGGRSATLAEVRRGLEAGERVVTVGAYGVDDGMRVGPATPKPVRP